jgi:hypothetical protein
MFGRPSRLWFNLASQRITLEYPNFQASYSLRYLHCARSQIILFDLPTSLSTGARTGSVQLVPAINQVDFMRWLRNPDRSVGFYCPK